MLRRLTIGPRVGGTSLGIGLSPRLASLALAIALWFASEGAARACGVWSLRDKDHGWLVVFRSTAVEIVHHPEEKKPRTVVPFSAARIPSKEYDWRLFRFDSSRREWRLTDKRAFSLKGGALRLGGKKIATLSKTDVKVGTRNFVLAFGEPYKPESSQYMMIPDNDGRRVTVSDGGNVVLEGAAPAEKHCPGTNRIAMYLVWRDVVFQKLASN